MLAYGMAAEEVIPTLTRLSEVAMGDAFKLDRLAFVMGQVKAATKLTAQDLRQFTEAGLNPLAEISRLTGLSMDELREKVTAGEISYKLISLAIEAATEKTGRFYGANARFAKTLQGEWGKLVAEARGLGREIGAFLVPALRSLIGTLRDGVSWLRSFDASQLKVSASIVTFGVSLVATLAILARLPGIIKTVVVALRAMASAQVITQALSGPKGWLVVTASIAAAAVATGLVVDQFNKLEKSIEANAEAAKGMADEASKIGDELPDEVKKIKEQMELELDIKGAGEIAEGGKAFLKAADKLRPGALLQGSTEAQSAINERLKPKLEPEIKAAAAAVAKVPPALNRVVDELRGLRQDFQPIAPAPL
jgi:tape measure domain-containing protein